MADVYRVRPAVFARPALAAAVIAVVALLVLFLPKTASAQTPAADEVAAAAAQPTTGTVELQPGANEVGWIAGAVDPQVLFDEIAELESIRAWHALDRRWQMAARDVPSSLWTLYRLVPGMGLRLQIAGDDAVQWERSLAPAKGKVELQPGDNFVAWAGRDGWDVNQLAKGIGRQLREIHRRNTGTGELDRIWPVAEGAEAATVARGEALWVKMPRSIVWLQPTDVMPRLVFPGGAPENVQTAVERDLRNTLDYFTTEYGIQAEATELAIYLPLELDALKRQLRGEEEEIDDIALNDIWSRTGGWAGERLVVKRYGNEDPDLPVADISYQRTMTHEYFHRIQGELRNGGDYDATWVVEGSANYAEQDQQVAAGERTWTEISSDAQQRMYDDAPRLLSAEFGNGTWQYYLGRLALQRLVERSRSSAWVDFYRELAPTQIGPANRWQSTPPWRDVFASTFDVDLDEFYAAFDQWQADLAARNGSRPADEAFDEPARIEGRIVRTDGSPVTGRFVSADEIVLTPTGERYNVGWTQRAETDAEGNFSVIAPNDGQYMLRIDLGVDRRCSIYYSREGGAHARDDADLLTVSGRTLRNVRFTVAAGACRHKLRGTVRGLDGEPLAGIRINGISRDGSLWLDEALTDRSGAFSITVPQDGDYRIDITLADSCLIYFTRSGATIDREAASLVQVAGADIRVDIRVPEDVCGNAISGRLLDASGRAMGDVWMTMERTVGGGGSRARGQTDSAGAFSITVPQDGDYRIRITLADSCSVYFTRSGATIDQEAASLVQVAGADIRVDIRVPEGVCGNAISGRLLDTAGEPMTDVQLAVFAEDPWSWHWGRTDSTGAFSVTVPQDGSYRIQITLAEGCAVYFASDGVTTDRDMAATVRVAGRDVRGNITVPDGWCEHAISGRLLDASGEPTADAKMDAIPSDGTGGAWTGTGADGAFTLTIPQDGGYHISITLADGCSVYFASGGVTADRDMAATVRVAGRDVRGNITIPSGWCEHAIRGRLLSASGEPMAEAGLYVISGDPPSWIWSRTDSTGRFRFTVPQDGSYQIYFTVAGSCGVFVARNGVTRQQHAAAAIQVAGKDVRVGDIRVPAGTCDE